AHVAQKIRGVEPEAALGVGDAGLRRLRNRPGGESIRHSPARQHLSEQMCASADNQIGVRLFATREKFRDLVRKMLAISVERDHSVESVLERPGKSGFKRRTFSSIPRMRHYLGACRFRGR